MPEILHMLEVIKLVISFDLFYFIILFFQLFLRVAVSTISIEVKRI